MTEVDPTPIDPSQIKTFIEIFKYGWELAKNTVGKARGAMIDEPKLQYAANNYRAKLLKLYGSTTILGKNKPVPLDDIFTDLFIWDKPQAMRRFSVEALEEAHRQGRSHEGLQRHEGLDVVEKHEYLFILGKPGAGKTTFLKWVTTQVAQDQDWMPYLPIFVNLKELADSGRTLIQQLVIELETCQFNEDTETFLTKLLEAGRVMVLLDGLDEVQAETGRQEQVIDDIRAFVKKYDKSRYLMTCRVAAVNFVFDTFTYVEMSDFNDEQIDEYIERYFLEDEESGKSCKELLRQPAQQKLRELARSPILLSLLCLNYEEARTFPSRRVELYEEALDALLKKWDNSRKIRRDDPYKEMSLGRKKQLYSHLAYHNFIQGNYFISSKRLEEQVEGYVSTMPGIMVSEVEGDILLRAMEAQHGILVERANQVHAFAHLTFQEYYTAKYIVDNVASGTLDELMKHIGDARWQEVFLLTSSIFANSDLFFEKFSEKLLQTLTPHPIDVRIAYLAYQRQHSYSVEPFQARLMTIGILLTARVVALYNSLITRARAYVRAFDLAHALTLARDLARDLNHALARDLDLARAYALDLAPELAPDLILDLDFARARGHAHALALARTRDHTLALDRSRARVRAPDRSYVLDTLLVWSLVPLQEQKLLSEMVKRASRVAWEMGEQELSGKLAAVPPQSDMDMQAQQAFQSKLMALAKQYRGLPLDEIMDVETLSTIDAYLAGTHLLLECLDLAMVTDREGIRARLLMPPAE